MQGIGSMTVADEAIVMLCRVFGAPRTDSAPYIETVSRVEAEKVRVTITHVDLIETHRDRQMYEWQTVEGLPLSQAG